MLSLIVNAFFIYFIIGICITAYRDLDSRVEIIKIFWKSLKWGFHKK